MIGKHPFQREKMAIRDRHASSRHAKTFYEVLERFARYSFVKAMPETGRTHQIRVHMAAMRHPLVGDTTYGADPTLAQRVGLTRPALHAARLEIEHPATGVLVAVESPDPPDFTEALRRLGDGA
jgi:23S rRNA pseudouridine1911/1915/1917 synthase